MLLLGRQDLSIFAFSKCPSVTSAEKVRRRKKHQVRGDDSDVSFSSLSLGSRGVGLSPSTRSHLRRFFFGGGITLYRFSLGRKRRGGDGRRGNKPESTMTFMAYFPPRVIVGRGKLFVNFGKKLRSIRGIEGMSRLFSPR